MKSTQPDSDLTLIITRPDDWHLHLRDGDMLAVTVPAAARYFGRAIVMPNLKQPVAKVEQARAYKERIEAQIPAGAAWQPLMTLYPKKSSGAASPD